MVDARRRAACAGLIASLIVGAASDASGDAVAPGSVVDAHDYDSFWLWAGVHAQPVLAGAKRVYLLQSEVTIGQPARLVSQRPAVPHVHGADVWLVVRAETLAWPPEVFDALTEAVERWRTAGNRLVGVQIDFDAHTRHLAEYASFLTDLRRRLPLGCRLGITGLLDWSANADPAGLAALAPHVDEVVVQIYQGRHVIPGYETYVRKLERLTIPFRIGLLQGGPWQPPPGLARNPYFAGYVVFLRNG